MKNKTDTRIFKIHLPTNVILGVAITFLTGFDSPAVRLLVVLFAGAGGFTTVGWVVGIGLPSFVCSFTTYVLYHNFTKSKLLINVK